MLVGDNGSGKSTIVDAAGIALGSLFQKLENATAPSISPDDARRVFVAQGDMADVQSQFPVFIGASGMVHSNEIEWSRALNGAKARMTRADATSIISVGEYYQKRVADGDGSLVLPILARYGTDRLWRQGGKAPDVLPSKTRGYIVVMGESMPAIRRFVAIFRRPWASIRRKRIFAQIGLPRCVKSNAKSRPRFAERKSSTTQTPRKTMPEGSAVLRAARRKER